MKIDEGALTIFPAELAKRRYELRAVCESGVLDTSRLLTLRRLLELCERAARRAGLLTGRSPGTAESSLLFEEAVTNIPFSSGQPIAKLSSAARAALLEQLIDKLAFTAEGRQAVTDWLLAHEPNHKLHGFGQMLNAWQALCGKRDLADRFVVNTALLQLIDTGKLPNELKDGLVFRSVRWLNPFDERFIAALKKRLGPEQVQVLSALPPAHAETAEDRLCSVVRSELEQGNEEEWKAWTEDFADALETDDSNILEADSQEKVSLVVAAHPYGEIEDAARRIAREIETGIVLHDIALIVRDVGPYTDIIPDVFTRFGIPYHFRRGTPASALPPVKALLALLAFPDNPRRDRLCDLLHNPSIEWPGVEDREAIVQELLKKEPPVLKRLPKELRDFFQPLEKSKQIYAVIKQHKLRLPEEVLNLIEELSELSLAPLPAERMIALFERLLDNTTVKDPADSESGVWILNPMDAAGLRFDSVFIADMDDRTFPKIPKADALFNKTERKALRAFLEERGIPCPRLALSETGELLIQEEILFLTAIGTARERLTLSYTQADTEGKERAPGEFFERMCGLTQKEPQHGESFHTILPPETVRAEDEARQTEAYCGRGFQPLASGRMPLPHIATAAIQRWLADNPEFSATALESLARNRFVFFLEKMLSIKPDRTHEDDTDPIDRGNVVHEILEKVYTEIAQRSGLYAVQSKASVPLVSNDRDGRSTLWKLSQKKEEHSIPLAMFDPSKMDELLALTREIAEQEFAKVERRPSKHLGHAAVWENEKRQILQVVENFVRMDCETAQSENRYPALFEMKFDAKHDLPVAIERDDETVQFKGKIDRIDLIFDDSGELAKLLVVDYKGKSRGVPMSQLEKEIELNLDCQLPLYTFAAQMKFFGACNTPELNDRVQAVYHLQERDLKKMTHHFQNKRLTMTPELTDAFLETLFSNVRKLRAGDLATEPLIAHFEDYSHICRTIAKDPKELLKEA